MKDRLKRLRMRWYNLRHQAEALNRRAEIEAILIDMSKGKRPLPTREECFALAMKLGTPKAYWSEKWK